MKKILPLLFLLILSVCLLYGFRKINKADSDDEEIWSGTVSFIVKQTGTDIIISEWKMEAIITSNKAKAIHSFHSEKANKEISDCKNTAETELSVGIDYDANKYSIEVPMPGCYGKQTLNGNTVDFAQSDETAIRIDDQPLKNPNILEGTIKENDGEMITTYTWHLERVNKINKKVTTKNNNPTPPVTGPFKKDLWSGTVIWSKFSTGKARVVSYDHGFENAFSWDHYLSFHTDVNFIKSKGTVYRADTVTKWEKDSTIFIHPQNKYMIEERTTKIYKKNKGEFDLEIEFSEDRKTYWITFFGPICREHQFFEKRNNIHGNTSDTSSRDDAGFQVTLPANAAGYPVGNNPNILSGTFKEIIPPNPDDPAHEAIITTAKWELKRASK